MAPKRKAPATESGARDQQNADVNDASSEPPATPSKDATSSNTATPRTASSAGSGKKRKKDEQSPPPSSHKKQTAVRETKEPRRPKAPGDPADTKSFPDFSRQESELAAYLGYKDICDLRRFVVSHTFLQHFLTYAGDHTSGVPSFRPLQEIRDEHLGQASSKYLVTKSWPERRAFWKDRFLAVKPDNTGKDQAAKKDAEKNYKQKQKETVAYVLTLLVQDVDNAPDLEWDHAMTQEAIKSLGRVYPNREIPDFTGKLIKYPVLKTTFQEESNLEPYNRALNLLRYAHWIFKSTWDKIENMKTDDSLTYNDKYIPPWMRPRPAIDPDAPLPENGAAEQHKALRHLLIELHHDDRWTREEIVNGESEEFADHLSERGPTLPLPVRQSSGDPRVHSQEQFMDTIRMDFQCIDEKLFLVQAIMFFPDDQRYSHSRDLTDSDWESVRKDLQTCSRGKVKVEVKLKKHDEKYHGPLELECSEPPA